VDIAAEAHAEVYTKAQAKKNTKIASLEVLEDKDLVAIQKSDSRSDFDKDKDKSYKFMSKLKKALKQALKLMLIFS
jgi:hypothetical protein